MLVKLLLIEKYFHRTSHFPTFDLCIKVFLLEEKTFCLLGARLPNFVLTRKHFGDLMCEFGP